MDRYDPLQAPDPSEWLALDEDERIELVRDYHRRARVKLPNHRLHAALHAIVENQVALGDEAPVRSILERLRKEGLDRHEAVHAIGSVVTEYLFDAAKGDVPSGDPSERYYAALAKLTAEGWRRAR